MEYLVQLAKDVATKAHAGQFRNDGKTPYITHCESVMQIADRNVHDQGLFEESPTLLDEIKQVAWLHDVIEDTSVTEEQLRDYKFSESVIEGVKAITKNPDKTKENYLEYLNRVKKNTLALIVKLADLEHNMSDLKPGNMKDKYALAIWFLNHR